jgi:50S ribosomal subunit-associated GTPase HflX
LNKIDLVEDGTYLNFIKDSFPQAVLISAGGPEESRSAYRLYTGMFPGKGWRLFLIKVPHTRMDLVSQFYNSGQGYRYRVSAEGD